MEANILIRVRTLILPDIYSLYINLRTYSAGNSQLLGQKDVGTVCIQFDRPTRLPAAGT